MPRKWSSQPWTARSFFSLVDHHVRLGDADELRHRLLDVEVLDLVPLFRRLQQINTNLVSEVKNHSSWPKQTGNKLINLLCSARARGSSLRSAGWSSKLSLALWSRGCRGQCWRLSCTYKHTMLDIPPWLEDGWSVAEEGLTSSMGPSSGAPCSPDQTSQDSPTDTIISR